MKVKNTILMIISMICPVIGIILYFIYSKDKAKSKNIIKGSVVGFCIYSIFILYFATHSIDYFNRAVSDWQKDVRSGNTVVTVIGASYCEHCQEYKPVIKALANKHNINLYFYEIDELSEEDRDKVEHTFELRDYQGSVPYTFIMKNGQFIDSHEGYLNEADTAAFLLKYGIIKN